MNKTLHYKDGKAILWNSSNVLTRKIKYEQFYYSCKMNIENLRNMALHSSDLMNEIEKM